MIGQAGFDCLRPGSGDDPDRCAGLASFIRAEGEHLRLALHEGEGEPVADDGSDVAAVPAPLMAERLRAAGAENAILSSDCGVFLLPPPVEGLREFLLLMREAGFSHVELRRMSAETPARLFRVGRRAPGAL